MRFHTLMTRCNLNLSSKTVWYTAHCDKHIKSVYCHPVWSPRLVITWITISLIQGHDLANKKSSGKRKCFATFWNAEHCYINKKWCCASEYFNQTLVNLILITCNLHRLLLIASKRNAKSYSRSLSYIIIR